MCLSSAEYVVRLVRCRIDANRAQRQGRAAVPEAPRPYIEPSVVPAPVDAVRRTDTVGAGSR